MNTTTDRRGEVLSILGVLACLAAFVVLLLVSLYGNSTAVFAVAWLALGTLGTWLVTFVQLHQQRLLAEERLELAALQRERQERLGGSQTIFDETDLDQMDALAMGRRMRAIERRFVPVAALATAAYQFLFGIFLLPGPWAFRMVREAAETGIHRGTGPVMMYFAFGVSFVVFVVSRWALGWAHLKEFRLLRPGGNANFGVALGSFAVALALVSVNVFDWPGLERGVATAIGVLMLILASETVLNFVLDFYRPRVPGGAQRCFYDSRLLGMFSEPGGILKSLADAVDYQFGFKVSETWFYQLLGKWIVPLLLIQASVTWLLTCIVIVPQGYAAVVERFRFGGSTLAVVAPGIRFTWPWPIDRATLIAVDRVQRFEIGYEHDTKQPAAARDDEPQLWTVKHRHKEHALLVPDERAAIDESLPLNLLSVTIPVQWRVKADDVLDYYKQARDVEMIVQAHAYRALTRYAARADILDVLSTGGAQAAEQIKADLQRALDHSGYDGGDLGVQIVHVSLANVHPLTDAADAYEGVVNAYQEKQARIREAEGKARQEKVAAGGLKYAALYEAILAEEAAMKESQNASATEGPSADEAAKLAECTRRVERLLRLEAGGAARGIVATADRRAYDRVLVESSRAKLFLIQLAAYQVAPDVYLLRKSMRKMEKALRDVRKYVLAMSNTERVMVQIDESAPVPADLISTTIQGLKESSP